MEQTSWKFEHSCSFLSLSSFIFLMKEMWAVNGTKGKLLDLLLPENFIQLDSNSNWSFFFVLILREQNIKRKTTMKLQKMERTWMKLLIVCELGSEDEKECVTWDSVDRKKSSDQVLVLQKIIFICSFQVTHKHFE